DDGDGGGADDGDGDGDDDDLAWPGGMRGAIEYS
ncbi:MAG: energy transducer TonB, partial [Deltaproteobacteria bacterium]|nr:energy transducer TonB [Deltaproteobacteria bacterium]